MNNMKFKNKETNVIVEARNMYEENILKGNSNYIIVKDVEEKKEKVDEIEKKSHKSTKKGGK